MHSTKIICSFCLLGALLFSGCERKVFQHKGTIRTTEDFINESIIENNKLLDRIENQESENETIEEEVSLPEIHEVDPVNHVLLKKAMKLKKEKKYKRALSILLDVFQTEPKNVSILENIALLYAELNQFKRAKYFAEKILTLEEKHIFALTILANSYAKQNKTNRAIETYLKIASISQNEVLYNNIAVLYEQEGKLLKAFEFYKKAARITPSAKTHYALYLISKRLNDQSNAVKYIELVVNRSHEVKYSQMLAKEYFLVKNYSKAIKVLNKLIQRRTHYDDYNILASSYIMQNNLKKAEEIYIKGIRQFPQIKELNYNLALCYYKMKNANKMKEAIKAYEKNNPPIIELRKLKVYLSKISK